jgi:hypothetical protein
MLTSDTANGLHAMQSFGASGTPDPLSGVRAQQRAAIAGAGIGYAPPASHARSAMIAEVLARADKAAALAQILADRAVSVVTSLIATAPKQLPPGADAADQKIGSPVVVRQLNDRLTDTFTALNRIDTQLGRLQAALG